MLTAKEMLKVRVHKFNKCIHDIIQLVYSTTQVGFHTDKRHLKRLWTDWAKSIIYEHHMTSEFSTLLYTLPVLVMIVSVELKITNKTCGYMNLYLFSWLLFNLANTTLMGACGRNWITWRKPMQVQRKLCTNRPQVLIVNWTKDLLAVGHRC